MQSTVSRDARGNSPLPAGRIATWIFISLIFAVAPAFAATISVTRGPYLQQGTPTSVILRWRTDVATESLARYGTSVGDFSGSARDSALVTNHSLVITNLDPATKYYYEIGAAEGWFPGDAEDYFVTSPAIGSAKATRVWVLGDSGTATDRAAAVRDAYAAYGRGRSTDLCLMLGDNAYDSGTDAEYQAAVFDMYPTFLRNTVLWPTIGNHDSDPAYFDMFTLPRNGDAGGVASGTENYYSFDYANIHFVCLDSSDSDTSTNGPMCTWLRADLEATTQQWLIAFWHKPPYSKGSHDSDTDSNLTAMRQTVVPILESYGVDLVLCGHSHSYERSFLIDGHYGLSSTFSQSMKKDGGDGRENGNGVYRKSAGLSSHEGAVYTVAGSSGKTSGGSLNHPAMFTSLNLLGSVVIDINDTRLDLVFLTTNAVAADYFTIIKAPIATELPAAPTNLMAVAVSAGQINLSWLDNADNEESFKIERSSNGVDFVQIATVGGNVTNGADIGLSSATTYYYRVRASNRVGDSDYSNIASADTPFVQDTTAPAAVTNLVVSSVSSNSARLAWIAPGGDERIGTAVQYDVRYNTVAITEANWSSAAQVNGTPTPVPAGNSQMMTVGGLAPGTIYYFGLKTADEADNWSPLSNIPRVTTLLPPAAQTNVAGTNWLVARNAVWKYLDNGSNQGTGWVATDFDDSGWLTGPGPLGYGDSKVATTVGYGPNSSAKFITTYFRNLFVLTNAAVFNSLTLRVVQDDGAVVYLNGREVYRKNMPAGAITSATKANSSGSSSSWYSAKVSPTNLVTGLNVLAVEVHQKSASSARLFFNLELSAVILAPDTTAPAAVTNLAISSVTSNGAKLTWTAPGDDGRSGTATLYDVRYSTAPITEENWTTAIEASGEPKPSSAGSSQTMTVSGLATGTTYYFALKTADETNNVSALSNVPFVTTPLPPQAPTNATSTNALVALNSVWKYLDNGSDQGAAWRELSFDDSGWANGRAELGYGDGDEATVVSYGPDASAKYITTYFRQSFNVADPSAYTNATVRLRRDDGAVVYINGVEVFRSNMPTGAITYVTKAVDSADANAYYSASVPVGTFIGGANVIAVEVHQKSGSSSDISFNLELTAARR